MNAVNLKVRGMACRGCENRIINALKNLDGDYEISANFKNGEVIVSSEKEINKNLVKETVLALGFDAE